MIPYLTPMIRWVIFLRGINVGGKNILKMADFRLSLTNAGFQNIQTYIQSGNILVDVDISIDRNSIENSIRKVLSQDYKLNIPVMALTAEDLKAAAAANPFLGSFDNPSWMFLNFLSEIPSDPDLESLKSLLKENERVALIGQVFYFYAGDGAARSKVMTKTEKCLGVSATARNWRTVQKMIDFACS